ncbi:MAG: COX15/CtaA family protein [Anaerolineae bacterium]
MSARTFKLDRFALYAWIVLLYNLVVILWGTFVRATSSGAGCGEHWPLCNGEIVPVAPQLATIIEFAHRTTSGISLVLVALLVIWAFRRYPKGHPVRFGATGSGIFIITEALVGAGLVLFGWVNQDQSVYRVVSISVHLVNTFLLLSMMTLTAWWASGGAPVRVRGQGAYRWALAIALLGVGIIGMTGAITALGDTLFPSGSLIEGLQQDSSPTASFLIRLRVIHPVIAVIVASYLLLLLGWLNERAIAARAGRFEWLVRALVVIQVAAGAINVILLAPIWMQLVHLLLADLVWIMLVLYSASLLNADLATATGRKVEKQGPVGATAE